MLIFSNGSKQFQAKARPHETDNGQLVGENRGTLRHLKKELLH